MNEIKFQFECWWPFGVIDVEADSRGQNIKIFCAQTAKELEIQELCGSDRIRILSRAKDEASYLRDMRFKKEPHPADGEFGGGYTQWVNNQCP